MDLEYYLQYSQTFLLLTIIIAPFLYTILLNNKKDQGNQ
jgi:hypothetical protein